MMKIAIFHNAVDDSSTIDEKDTLDQVEGIENALRRLGHHPFRVPCTIDLSAVAEVVAQERPDLGFNMVESLGARGQLIHLVPTLLDTLGLPYTGCSSDAIYLTSQKLVAKAWMEPAGIPLIPTLAAWPETPPGQPPGVRPPASIAGSFLIKSQWEHASVGLSGDFIIPATEYPRLHELLAERAPALGGSCFAEPFIEGREFNLSVLGGPAGPQVMPPAEILFVDYPPDKPRLVNYESKWVEASFEYQHTPRTFDFPASDAPLLERLTDLTLVAWHRFGLRGWARVDFRVHEDAIFMLEVNANPCITEGAGFASAAERAGLSYDDVVARIVADGVQRPGDRGRA
jgi:D-alanine-D-alanine ligase